jgi:hypothetical protein
MKIPLPSIFRHRGIVCIALLNATSVLTYAGSAMADAKNVKAIAPPAEDPWEFKLGIPGWLANTSGTVGLDGINTKIYLGADTLIKDLDMIATFDASVRKGRFGFYGDFLYVSASDGVGTSGILKKVDVQLDQTLADMELTFRALEGPRGYLDLRAGVRYTNIYNKVTLQPNDQQISADAERLVDDVSTKVSTAVKQELQKLDLKTRLKSALEGRIKQTKAALESGVESHLTGASEKKGVLPEAHLAGKRTGRVRELISEIIDRRAGTLVTAIEAAAQADKDAAKAAADAAVTAKIAATKSKADQEKRAIANQIKLRAERARLAAQLKVNQVKTKLENEISSTLSSKLNTSQSLDEDWWDPYVGFAARLNLGKAFYLTAKADIGGFGVSSDLTWQASGALGCQISRSIYAELGYRYLYTDYNRNGFLYEVSQSGVQLEAGISF